MMYDPKALDLEWNDETQRYAVWYDGMELGTAKDEEEAHYMVIDYVVAEADMWSEE